MEYHGQFYLAGLAFAGEANGEAGEASGEAGEASGEAVVKHQSHTVLGGEDGEAVSPISVDIQSAFAKLSSHQRSKMLELLTLSTQNQLYTEERPLSSDEVQ